MRADLRAGAHEPRSPSPAAPPRLEVAIPEDLVEAIAFRAAEIVVAKMQAEAKSWPEWMSITTAAAYLDVSVERVRKLQARRQLPFHQEAAGCRVFFRRTELDEAMSRVRQG
jgi:excisionase family DNA binding protein